ncbi:MAG: diaminopimelate epimerase [Candidatus Omnitrophota bacterium]
MKKLNFTKMVASGNDFVIAELRAQSSGLRILAQKICDRKYGVGADGLLVLERSKIAGVRMRIFNADGTEAQMCGNGARCVALFTGKSHLEIETKAGIIEANLKKGLVRIKLTDCRDIKLDIPIPVNHRSLKVNFINTGVPHAVIFVEGLDKIDVNNAGRQIRYHNKFMPAGTNVDFVEILDRDSIKVRTYERGVEDETLACGTGSVASAIICSFKLNSRAAKLRFKVKTQGGEILRVHFTKKDARIKDVWLEGCAKIVYEGEYNV